MTFKILFIGAENIGKTQLCNRLSGKRFSKIHTATVAATFTTAAKGKCQLWDIGGNELYELLIPIYTRSAEVVFLCFDPRNSDSFARLQSDISSLKSNVTQNCQFVLVETRSDLKQPKLVSNQEMDQFMAQHQILLHVQTSAKTGAGLSQLRTILKGIYEHKYPSAQLELELEAEDTAYYSFVLNAISLTAAIGGAALCIAALVTSLTVGFVPVGAAILASGLFLGTVAVGTFFYRRMVLDNEESKAADLQLT